MANTASSPSRFDVIVRLLSTISLAGSLLTSTVYLLSLRGPGVDLTTHIFLGLMFFAQPVVFFLGVVIAAFITARRSQFRVDWFSRTLFCIAVTAFAGQYYAVRHMHVDS